MPLCKLFNESRELIQLTPKTLNCSAHEACRHAQWRRLDRVAPALTSSSVIVARLDSASITRESTGVMRINYTLSVISVFEIHLSFESLSRRYLCADKKRHVLQSTNTSVYSNTTVHAPNSQNRASLTSTQQDIRCVLLFFIIANRHTSGS